MTLEYKILWIDNDDSIYRHHQNDIEEHLLSLGFSPKITKGKDYNTFIELESELNDFNLFILDYKLDKIKDNNGLDKVVNGNKIIQDIRDEKSIYTDVIFYSAVENDMREQAYKDKLNGVYFTSRNFDDFEDDVLGVIDVTIKKVQDVNNLRGLIMAEVAELDRIKKSILLKYNTKNKDCTELKKYIKDNVFENINEELADLECITNSDCEYYQIDFEKLINNFFYDSYKKSRTVFKVKKLDTKCSTIPFIHQDYYKEVIKKRNVFAHEEEKIRPDGTKYLNYPNGKPLEFNKEHCIKIRKDIKKYKELLEVIEKQI